MKILKELGRTRHIGWCQREDRKYEKVCEYSSFYEITWKVWTFWQRIWSYEFCISEWRSAKRTENKFKLLENFVGFHLPHMNSHADKDHWTLCVRAWVHADVRVLPPPAQTPTSPIRCSVVSYNHYDPGCIKATGQMGQASQMAFLSIVSCLAFVGAAYSEKCITISVEEVKNDG